MNYYTSKISATLAEKLKEAGMPNIFLGGKLTPPTYGGVFDWMLRKHEAYVNVFPLRTDDGWRYCGCVQGWGIDMTLGWKETWHEAANAAIEKALTLI